MYSKADQIRAIRKERECSLQEARQIFERNQLLARASTATDINDLRQVIIELIKKTY